MTVFIPLWGPNDQGRKPKSPRVNGWQSPGYKGINPRTHKGWYGLRCDGLLVIDCDCAEARALWTAAVERTTHDTYKQPWVRKTPRGWHFIYTWTEGAPEGPHAGVLPGVDIRQGPSSQIVYAAPNYYTIVGGPDRTVVFNPAWADSFVIRKADTSGDTWDEMPEGVGNNTMAALAGTMRKQGMSPFTMARCLAAINRITMSTDPMPKEMVLDIVRSVSRYEIDPFVDEIKFDDA